MKASMKVTILLCPIHLNRSRESNLWAKLGVLSVKAGVACSTKQKCVTLISSHHDRLFSPSTCTLRPCMCVCVRVSVCEGRKLDSKYAV